jgi:hypothetical protein
MNFLHCLLEVNAFARDLVKNPGLLLVPQLSKFLL